MKKIISLGALVIAFGAFSLYLIKNNNEGKSSALTTYTDQQNHFSFKYPSSWSVCKKATDTEYVTVSDDCDSRSDKPFSYPINYFEVRVLGDMATAYPVKPDTGWGMSGRAISYIPQNVSLFLVGKSEVRDTLDQISSSFIFLSVSKDTK